GLAGLAACGVAGATPQAAIPSCNATARSLYVPPPGTITEDMREPLDALPAMGLWVRGTLVGLALGLSAVFAVAVWLKPYDDDGRPLRMEAHRQLGLPPCTFYSLTGIPCPSCGMTTSFALLVRGDVVNSARANAAGTV